MSRIITTLQKWPKQLLTVRKRRRRCQNEQDVIIELLPAEILLIVFELLRHANLWQRAGWHHRKPYRDLLSCQTVCRAWCGPATEALYRHVALDSADSIRLFVSARRAAKGSAPRIEGLHLKSWTVQYFRTTNNRPLFRMKKSLAHLEALVASVDGPTSISVGYDSFHRDSDATVTWEDARVPLLHACTPRLRRLHLDGDYDADTCEFLHLSQNSLLFTSARFCFLEDLALSDMTLGSGDASPRFAINFMHLGKLTLYNCHFGYIWIQQFIKHAPPLQQLALRSSECFSHALYDPSPAQILDQHVVHVTRLQCTKVTGISCARDWHSFVTLRTLIVTSSALHAVPTGPPALEELTVYMSPHRGVVSGELWHETAILWAVVRSWKATSPSLRLLALWGSVETKSWRTWQAIGLLFHGVLSRRDVQLNIYLDPRRL